MIDMNIVEKIPLPICGLILALISLGTLTEEINVVFKYAFGLIGVIFLILIILKIIIYPKKVGIDLKNPVILSSFGTFSMTLMILSTYFISYSSTFAYALWICGITIHILIMIYFHVIYFW